MVTRLSVTSLLVPGWVVSGSMVASPFSVSCWVSGVWQTGDGGRISRTSSLPLNTLHTHTNTHRGARRSIGCRGTRMGFITHNETRRAAVPSVFGSGSRHVIKLHFPANALFISLHRDDFACEPLFVDAHFNQQTLIWGGESGKFFKLETFRDYFPNSTTVVLPFWAFLASFSGFSCMDFSGAYKHTTHHEY